MTRLINITDVADLIGRPVTTIRNKISAGTFEIPTALVCNRRVVRESDLLDFIDRLFREPPPPPPPLPPGVKRGRGRPRKIAPATTQ